MLRTSALLLSILPILLAPAAANAAPILSQTVYLCSVGLDCLAPLTSAGPVPVDPDAFAGNHTTTPLDPGASLSGFESGAGLLASTNASSVGFAPPELQLRVEDTTLADDQAVIAHMYWEDTLTIDALAVSDFGTLTWTPQLEFGGIMDLFAGITPAGGVEWSFNIAVNTNTILSAGGFCQPGIGAGAVDCSSNTGFGPSFPASTFVLDNFSFLVQAGAVVRIQGPDITGGVELDPVRWLGMTVGDVNGIPLDDFTVSSDSGIDWTIASVPEPGTAVLFGLGLASLAARRGRDPA